VNRFEIMVGLVSLLPAAVNASSGQGHQSLLVQLCTGDGQIRTMQLPVGKGGLPGKDPANCCAKGCHSGASRKRNQRKLDSSQ